MVLYICSVQQANATTSAAAIYVKKYKTLSDVYEGFSLYAARAERVSGGLLLESPSPALDEMFNFYVPYQALATRLLARTGFYQSGGAYGFRDQLQDCLAILYSHPKKVRVHIIRAALHQFAQGDAIGTGGTICRHVIPL